MSHATKRAGRGPAPMQGDPMRFLAKGSFLLSASLLCACGISPQPLPPGGEPEIAVAKLSLESIAAARVRLSGAPGSVEHASVLRITNLDGTMAPLEVPVALDGSVAAELDGLLGESFRLQAREEAVRSIPVDVTGNGEGEPVVVSPVATPCLTLDPLLELVGEPVPLGAPIQILPLTVTNDCTAEVVLSEVTLRMGLSEFTSLVGGAVPRTLLPAESFVVEIGAKAMSPGEYEEVVFLVLDGPGGPRRAVTFRATTLP